MTFPAPLSRRIFTAAVLCSAAFAAGAQDKYPSKPITVVVPQAAGGANDAIARVVAQKLSEQMGQSVIVDNRPGAGGTLATGTTARARNDGYTLLLTADSAHVIGPALYKNPGFDPVKDFAPVAPVATAGYVLVAHPSFPANTVAEMVALAKANPGKYAIASAGNGTLNHLIGEMLQKAAGIQLQHIPYKGSAAAATDVVGGQVPLSVQSLPSAIAFIKAGKLKVLGVVNEKRVAALPDAPTIGETIKGFGQAPWYALFARLARPRPSWRSCRPRWRARWSTRTWWTSWPPLAASPSRARRRSWRRWCSPTCLSGAAWSRTRVRRSIDRVLSLRLFASRNSDF